MDPVHFSIQTRQGSKNTWLSGRGRELINAIGQRSLGGACVHGVTSQRRYGRWLRCALTRLQDASALKSHNTRLCEKEGGIEKKLGGAKRKACKPLCRKSVYAVRWVSSSAGQWVQRRRKNLKRNCYGTWNERWVRFPSMSCRDTDKYGRPVHPSVLTISLSHSLCLLHNQAIAQVSDLCALKLWEVWDDWDVVHQPGFISTVTCWMMSLPLVNSSRPSSLKAAHYSPVKGKKKWKLHKNLCTSLQFCFTRKPFIWFYCLLLLLDS